MVCRFLLKTGSEIGMMSNCLFEAIKAKLKDPKNVRIIRLPKEISSTAHFMWINKNNVYHAYDYKHSKNHFLFDCKIKSIPDYVFESFILNEIEFNNNKINLAKKCGLKITDYKSEWNWSFKDLNYKNLPTQLDIDFFEKVLKCQAKFKLCIDGNIKTVNLDELKSQNCDFEWKMIDLYDPDFERVYRGHKLSKLSDITN